MSGCSFPRSVPQRDQFFVVQGQSGELQLDGQSLSLEGVQWVIPGQGLRGTAQGLSRAAEGRILLRDAHYSMRAGQCRVASQY